MISVRNAWLAGNPFKTAFANSLSVSVPESERFILKTATQALPFLTDQALRTRTEVLIHEEGAHSKMHDRYNEILKNEGYNLQPFEESEKKMVAFFTKHASLKTRLAICLSTEHFTFLLSKHVLEQGTFEEEGTDERMKRIWLWHSLEEVHHRSTALDVYRALGGGYVRRVLVMFMMTVLYFSTHIHVLHALLKQDDLLSDSEVRQTGRSFLFGWHGFYTDVFRGWLPFFLPGFHPDTHITINPELIKRVHHYHVEEELLKTLA